MSNLSDFLISVKPKLITLYTSGSGTYVPTVDMARCFVKVTAGGGGGTTYGGYGAGGGAGATVWGMFRIPIAGWAYTIGAGGSSAGGNGSRSYFNHVIANPGKGGGQPGASNYCWGGIVHSFCGEVDADSFMAYPGSGFEGVSGGAGGSGLSGTYGQLVGFPAPTFMAWAYSPNINIAASAASNVALGAGGDSYYGPGGGLGVTPSAYGAGGGGHASVPASAGAGAGGCVEIWDYGA